MPTQTTLLTDGGGNRVLVADDEEALRSLLTIRLEQADFEVITAGDGEEALELLIEAGVTAFDALILDLGMPRMDGFELLEHLGGDLPITIVLSGRDSDDNRQRAFDLGATDYIVKPFSPADLADLIHEYLR